MKKETFWTSSAGGIALESAFVMPLFSCFIFSMMSFMLIAMCDIGLSSAVSETTKQIAVHWYPVDEITKKAGSSEAGQQVAEWISQVQEWRSRFEATKSWFDTYARFLPAPLLSAIDHALNVPDRMQQQMDDQFQQVLSAAFQPLLLAHTDRHVFLKDQGEPRITHVYWPSFANREEAYFGLEAESVFVLPIPFVRQEIRLKHRAVERLWVGH